MSGVLVVARREIVDRAFVLVTAAVLATMPFLAVLLPGVARHGAQTVIAMVGGFVVAGYVLGLALILGTSIVGRELTDKRLSFYFSKPLDASAVWFGKLAGGLFTVFASMAIIVVPVLLASGAAWERMWMRETAVVLGVLSIAAIALFLLGHTFGTMSRSRSSLMLVDLAAIGVIAMVSYLFTAKLREGLALELIERLDIALAICALLIMIGAGAWQLSRGRTEIRRSHREMSRFLWVAAAVVLAIAGGWVAWVVNVSPSDLGEETSVDSAKSGDWVTLGGKARNRADYRAAFLVNVANGAWQRWDGSLMYGSDFATRDGKVIGRLKLTGDSRENAPYELELLRLGERDVQAVPTRITLARRSRMMANEDATRVAVFSDGGVSVETVPDGQTLTSARIAGNHGFKRGFFVTNDLLRVYAYAHSVNPNVMALRVVEIYELDVTSRTVTKTGEIRYDAGRVLFSASADGSKLLVRSTLPSQEKNDGLHLVDARTGSTLGSIAFPPEARLHNAAMLSDGRVVTTLRRGATARSLAVYGPDLILQREVPLGDYSYTYLSRELAGGKVVLAVRNRLNENDARAWSTVIVDTVKGAVVQNVQEAQPLFSDSFGWVDTDPRPPARILGTAVSVTNDRELARLDATTGARTPVMTFGKS